MVLADETVVAMRKVKPLERDLEKLRQLGQVILAASRLPGPTDSRPPSPDTRTEDGMKFGGRTTGGLARGVLMQAHRADRGGSVAPVPPPAPEPPAPEEPPVDEDRPLTVDEFREALRERRGRRRSDEDASAITGEAS